MIINVIYVDKLQHKGYPSLPKYAVNIFHENFIENKTSTNHKNCHNFSNFEIKKVEYRRGF